MSMYPLQKALDLWAQGSLTVKQAIGQILQHLLVLEKRVTALEHRPGPNQAK